MKRIVCIAFVVCVLHAAGQAGKPSSAAAKQAKSQIGVKPYLDERGQWVFEHNCMRCHNPPQDFPAHISQTVAMHMRVRANLSEADYKALLHFLNP